MELQKKLWYTAVLPTQALGSLLAYSAQGIEPHFWQWLQLLIRVKNNVEQG